MQRLSHFNAVWWGGDVSQTQQTETEKEQRKQNESGFFDTWCDISNDSNINSFSDAICGINDGKRVINLDHNALLFSADNAFFF